MSVDISSPTGMQFKSCKDAAVYLTDQSLIDAAGALPEVEMRQINNASPIFLKSINEVISSSTLHDASTSSTSLPGITNLHDVEITDRIDCFPCGLTFTDMNELTKHLGVCHHKTTRRFTVPKPPHSLDMVVVQNESKDPREGVGHDEPRLGEPSSSLKQAVTSKVNEFRTECTWCNKEFVCEGVDAETMADATGFMCPNCKEKLCGGLEKSLSRSYQQ